MPKKKQAAPTGAKTIYHGTFEYQPHQNTLRNPTICNLEVLRHNSTSLVIATELASNPGMSITNSSERLAMAVVERLSLDPATMTMVEHYGDVSYNGTTAVPLWGKHDIDHYSIVTYTWHQDRIAEHFILHRASKPQWQPMTAGELVQLREGLGH